MRGRIVMMNWRRFYHNDKEIPYRDVPEGAKSHLERKPYVTPMKTLIARAKAERVARRSNPCYVVSEAPENGLVVPHLVEVAASVHRSRLSLLRHVSKLMREIPLLRCTNCSEVHVGKCGHEIRSCVGDAQHVWTNGSVSDAILFPECFHLRDRVRRPRVSHCDRERVPRLPAILELCIQAGLDHPLFPATRRTRPVYYIDGLIKDFERPKRRVRTNIVEEDGDIEKEDEDEDGGVGERGLGLWFEMMNGTEKIMKKYKVWSCGYCKEVQVGPKGHKVRDCKGFKHVNRQHMHAWQEATIDDLVGPNYVWHVPNGHAPLIDSLKSFYGKAPALVEMCVQAGANVPIEYHSMMRPHVVLPHPDELDLVA